MWHPDEQGAQEGPKDGPSLLLMSSTASMGMVAMASLLLGERPPVQNGLCEGERLLAFKTGNCALKRQKHTGAWECFGRRIGFRCFGFAASHFSFCHLEN